jgi:hypothetical protein
MAVEKVVSVTKTRVPKGKIHEITVVIPKSVVSELENAIKIKNVYGSFFGMEDEFIAHVVRAIREGKKLIVLEKKKR